VWQSFKKIGSETADKVCWGKGESAKKVKSKDVDQSSAG